MSALEQEQRAEGVYKGKVLNTALMESNNGTPFIEIRCRLDSIEDEATGKWEPTEPFTAACPRYLSEKALPISLADLAWLGFAGKSFEELAAFDFSGKEVFVKLAYEEYQGKTRPKYNLQRRRKAVTPERLKTISSNLNDLFAGAMSEVLGEGGSEEGGTNFNFGANAGGWPEPSNN